MSGEAIKGHLNLLLLSVLAREPLHGYAIIDQLRRRSNETFDLPEGTVYPALHRLERDGLISSRWESSAGRKRRVYLVTRKGRRALADHRREWDGFSAAVGAVIGGRA